MKSCKILQKKMDDSFSAQRGHLLRDLLSKQWTILNSERVLLSKSLSKWPLWIKQNHPSSFEENFNFSLMDFKNFRCSEKRGTSSLQCAVGQGNPANSVQTAGTNVSIRGIWHQLGSAPVGLHIYLRTPSAAALIGRNPAPTMKN